MIIFESNSVIPRSELLLQLTWGTSMPGVQNHTRTHFSQWGSLSISQLFFVEGIGHIYPGFKAHSDTH